MNHNLYSGLEAWQGISREWVCFKVRLEYLEYLECLEYFYT